MANEDGTIWTIFNGEIYNHRELRQHLQSRGHRFNGRSDTEVLPHLYEEEGPDFIKKLRGMFALAIYDTRSRILILARDRFGIKPLFFTTGRNRLAFASEIKALRDLPGIDTRPDRQAIYDFAALFYIPAPETFYMGIRAIQPGEMLQAHFDGSDISVNFQIYHRWSIVQDPTVTLEMAVDRADALVSDAVQRQIESDVPVGALLSGGIDSSLVSVAAQGALNGGLRTFNVRFAEKNYDETWAAVAVATKIKSYHETLNMDGVSGTWDYITNLLLHAGQPFADTSVFAVDTICRLMRSHVTVALSGDGGDEGFGGYDLYWRIARISQWQKLPRSVRHGLSATLSSIAPLGFVPIRLAQRLEELAEADSIATIQSLFCWVNEEEHKTLCRDTDLLPVRRLFEPQWDYHLEAGASPLERLSALATEVNTRLTLPNDFLFKVDIASMKESLEIRVPLLDEDLFAFGLSLPHRLKVKGRTCKRVLRAVASRKLPSVIANKPKHGFAIPVDAWVNAEFKNRLKDTLLGPSSGLSEIFRPDVYRPIVQAFCGEGQSSHVLRGKLYQMVIMLLSVHLNFTSAYSEIESSSTTPPMRVWAS